MQHHHGAATSPTPVSRPRFEVGELARAHGPDLIAEGGLDDRQLTVLRMLGLCRTQVLGGHVDVCADCGHGRPAYNSCRNRHCPKCQFGAQQRWLERRRARLLPVHYFHVVFTLPSELRSLFRFETGGRLLELLIRSAAATLLELGRDERYLGARLGLTTVLHTWSRDLSWHPHVHCVVTGGGLRDDGTWRATKPSFLFPVRVLGALFRGKILEALERLHRRGELPMSAVSNGDPQAWSALRRKLYSKSWVVYCKPPFNGVDSVFVYLGRYTHRIGLSNRRLLDVTESRVTFATRHGKSTTLPPRVFLRRFLAHVLPRGFHRIRHYGLLASANVDSRLVRAREALGASTVGPSPPSTEPTSTSREDELDASLRALEKLTGLDLRTCPACGGQRMGLRRDALPRGPP